MCWEFVCNSIASRLLEAICKVQIYVRLTIFSKLFKRKTFKAQQSDVRLNRLCVCVCNSTESGQPICGNGLVEPGEECDCGYNDQCKDQCCYDANQPDNQKCKLKFNKVCRYTLPFFLLFRRLIIDTCKLVSPYQIRY